MQNPNFYKIQKKFGFCKNEAFIIKIVQGSTVEPMKKIL